MHLKHNTVNVLTLFLFQLLVNTVLSYDYFEGYNFGVRMSYLEVKKQGLLFFKRIEYVSIDYPEGTNITGIACLDLSEDKNSDVTIIEGGINQNYVKLRLESERSHGLKYVVEVYTFKHKIDFEGNEIDY